KALFVFSRFARFVVPPAPLAPAICSLVVLAVQPLTNPRRKLLLSLDIRLLRDHDLDLHHPRALRRDEGGVLAVSDSVIAPSHRSGIATTGCFTATFFCRFASSVFASPFGG